MIMRHCFLKIAAVSVMSGTTLCHAQLFGSGIVYDPTQSAHAIEQISQGEHIFTNTVKLADNAIATYNLARQMAAVPQSLYRPLLSPSTYWIALNRAANTYGNSQQWTTSLNSGLGVSIGYEQASLPRLGQISGYSNLSATAQRLIAAHGATADLNDSVTTGNMQTLGTIRAHSTQRQADINALVSATQSPDPTQHTELATLQRINQALVLLIQEQQEANQIGQAYTLQQIIGQKQQQDSLKATFQQASQFPSGFTSAAPSYGGAAAAMRY
jgi:hypothetical protein